MENNTEIILDDTINIINNLSNESDKKEFDKNFFDSKEKIKIVDNILDKSPEIDENLSIDLLFEMLQEYNEYIENDKSINIIDFKKIKDIVELIEKKMSESKINIIEIK